MADFREAFGKKLLFWLNKWIYATSYTFEIIVEQFIYVCHRRHRRCLHETTMNWGGGESAINARANKTEDTEWITIINVKQISIIDIYSVEPFDIWPW